MNETRDSANLFSVAAIKQRLSGGRLGSAVDQAAKRPGRRKSELTVEERVEPPVLDDRGRLVALGQVGPDQGAAGTLAERLPGHGGQPGLDRGAEFFQVRQPLAERFQRVQPELSIAF